MVEQVSVLCANNTHVYRAGSPRCDCGVQANNPPVGVYPFPASYVPNPHHPRYQPVAVPEIPASVKAKAIEAGASHLSADGQTAYKLRMGIICRADWLKEQRAFGSWWDANIYEMPCGVISLE